MKYYLGLDNGGTATKASVYDELGRELATAGTDTVMLIPRPSGIWKKCGKLTVR